MTFLRALIAATLVACLIPVVSGQAQQVLGIAAVVDDQVISAYDLEERMDLVIASASLPRTEETRRRLRVQILRTLVDEELQKRAARDAGVNVTGTEIDQEIDAIADRNNMTGAALLSQLTRAGVEEHALRQQVLATIAWQKFMGLRLLRTVDVAEEEIDEAIRQIEAQRGQKSYQISEIVLTVPTAREENEVRASAERLVRQIQGGARFDALARQFSDGATAQQGGDVGWVSAEQMGTEIAAAITAMQPGNVSDPVRTTTGFAIVGLRAVRTQGQDEVNDVEVTLSQLLIPLGRNAAEADVTKAVSAANALRELITECGQARPLASRLTAASAADLGKLRIGDLPQNFREAIAPLDKGEVSPPLRTAAGIHLLIVCDRSLAAAVSADRSRIRNEILTRKLNQRAQSLLRDMRRDAIVDYR